MTLTDEIMERLDKLVDSYIEGDNSDYVGNTAIDILGIFEKKINERIQYCVDKKGSYDYDHWIEALEDLKEKLDKS